MMKISKHDPGVPLNRENLLTDSRLQGDWAALFWRTDKLGMNLRASALSCPNHLWRRCVCVPTFCAANFLMKPGTITHTIAVLLSSVSSLFAQSTPAKAPASKVKVTMKSDRLADVYCLN